MKAKALALVLFAAGVFASYALAGNGHGNKHDSSTTSSTSSQSTSTATTTTSEHGNKHGAKVTICHKAGHSGRWVKITIGAKAAARRLEKGDQLPDASGNCPAPTPPTTTGTTTTTSTESGD